MTPNKTDTLKTWLDYLAKIHVSAIDMGLDRVLPVFERMGIRPKATVITVAGTNGKGSVTATIASICRQAGYQVGLYQSPHLLHFNERVTIDGRFATDDELISAFLVVDEARKHHKLTLSFFEMTTLAAFWLFAKAECDVWVLEVGLGGRLDVVNVIEPTVAVITNVAIDHTDWLGCNRQSIGYEKAGIIRPNIPVIYGECDLPSSVSVVVNDCGAVLSQYGIDFDYVCKGEDFIYSSWATTLRLPLPRLSVHNTATAIAAVLASGLILNHQHLKDGIATTNLAGRFDWHSFDGRQWLFDVAHNVAGLEFFLHQWLQGQPNKRSWYVVFSMLADKPLDAVVVQFLQAIRVHGIQVVAIHLAPLDNPRATPISVLEQTWRRHTDVTVVGHHSMAEAALSVQRRQDEHSVLCFGSFHTVAEVLFALSG